MAQLNHFEYANWRKLIPAIHLHIHIDRLKSRSINVNKIPSVGPRLLFKDKNHNRYMYLKYISTVKPILSDISREQCNMVA